MAARLQTEMSTRALVEGEVLEEVEDKSPKDLMLVVDDSETSPKNRTQAGQHGGGSQSDEPAITFITRY